MQHFSKYDMWLLNEALLLDVHIQATSQMCELETDFVVVA